MSGNIFVAEDAMVLKAENERLRASIQLLLKQIGKPAECRKCHKEIWWVRHLNGKLTPYTTRGVNHLVDCPFAKEFKKR